MVGFYWISFLFLVLREEHRHLLNETATTLQLALKIASRFCDENMWDHYMKRKRDRARGGAFRRGRIGRGRRVTKIRR